MKISMLLFVLGIFLTKGIEMTSPPASPTNSMPTRKPTRVPNSNPPMVFPTNSMPTSPPTNVPNSDPPNMSTNPPFNTEDSLVGYAAVKQIASREDPINYRNTGRIVQYQISLHNETLSITLRPNKDLFTPGCLVHTYLPGGRRDIRPCAEERLHCYYTGKSDAHKESWVSADICDGLTGVIGFNERGWLIKPVNTTGEMKDDVMHAIYRFHGNKRFCPMTETAADDNLHVVHGRQRRAPTVRYVDTRLVVDPRMYHAHKNVEEVKAYTMMAFNIASKLYKDPSIGAAVRLRLSELIIISINDEFTSNLTRNANNTLKTFCKWQSQLQTDADCSVLLTRLNLETDDGLDSLNGLAYLNNMCYRNRRCAVVQDEGPIFGVTMAHEIGHLLGMTHDDGRYGYGIMSSGGWSGREAFTWSSRSSRQLRVSLGSNRMYCLVQELRNQSDSSSEIILPGTVYTANDQCKMRGDERAVFHLDKNSRDDPCNRIKCTVPGSEIPLEFSAPLLDGTDCRNTRTYCIKGQCVPIDSAHASLPPVNGAWSKWSAEYNPCTRTCGGGVQIKNRLCNNPPPQYGGKWCEGSSIRVRLCNAQACESDYRFEQCSKISNTSTWTPSLGEGGNGSCIKLCTNGTTYLQGGHYGDGTECMLADVSDFARCVNGNCLSFGCDGYLNSGMKYDKCGVCNGMGDTCTEVSGTYTKKYFANVYTNVTTIPAGSSGIRITEWNRFCYLSLSVDGNVILNANLSHTASAVFSIAGIHFRYTLRPEVIEVIGKTNKDILVQVYRGFNYSNHPGVDVSPHVEYTYYTPNPGADLQAYWAEIPGQICSKSCGTGYKTNILKCMSVKGPVEDHYCDIQLKPAIKHVECNTQPCHPSWKPSSWSDCSQACGEGNMTRLITCVQTSNGIEQELPWSRCEDLGHPRPTSVLTCNNVCYWNSSKWTECSTTCGKGTMNREVKCVRDWDGAEVNIEYCGLDKMPKKTGQCENKPCNTGLCVEHERCDKTSTAYCNDNHYKDWMRQNCPYRCHVICTDCEDCTLYDTKYCRHPQYINHMSQNCAKTCRFCSS